MSRVPRTIERPYRISVTNAQKSPAISKRRLEEIARTTLETEGVAEAEISIAVLGDEEIQRVNLEYLGHDYPPDVLSFVLDVEGGEGEATGRKGRGTGKILSGEILLGAEEAIRGGERFGWPPENELTLYLVHGLLHLCGYDDLVPSEKRIMREREKAILGIWGLTPPYLKREGREKKPRLGVTEKVAAEKRTSEKSAGLKGKRSVSRRGGKRS